MDAQPALNVRMGYALNCTRPKMQASTGPAGRRSARLHLQSLPQRPDHRATCGRDRGQHAGLPVVPEGIGVNWRCPRCGRRFAHEDQFHSHDTVDIDAHFTGRPAHMRASFDRLIGSLPSGVQVEALRSVIVLSAHTTFSFITVQSRRLLVGIFLDRQLDSPRIVKVDVVTSRKIANTVDVRGPDEIDDELCRWLREAYGLRADPAHRPSTP